jgi:non-homologous end joining protein Ku
LKAIIKGHLEGKEVTAVAKPAKVAPVTDLMAALKQSLASMEGKKKGPQRVEAAEASSRAHVKSGAKKKRSKTAA